jgi:hypothetical protein
MKKAQYSTRMMRISNQNEPVSHTTIWTVQHTKIQEKTTDLTIRPFMADSIERAFSAIEARCIADRLGMEDKCIWEDGRCQE